MQYCGVPKLEVSEHLQGIHKFFTLLNTSFQIKSYQSTATQHLFLAMVYIGWEG